MVIAKRPLHTLMHHDVAAADVMTSEGLGVVAILIVQLETVLRDAICSSLCEESHNDECIL